MQDEDSEKPEQRRIGAKLSEVVLSGPAVWANHVLTTNSHAGVKLTFAETNPESDDVKFRAGVYLEAGTALALFDLLGDLISNNPELKKLWEGVQESRDG